jgi:hypothetical protein
MSMAGRSGGTGAPPFSRAAVIGLIGAGLLTFMLSFVFMIDGAADIVPDDRIGASTYSSAALGYKGLAELLQATGSRVVQARHDPAAALGDGGLLIIAEPDKLDWATLPKKRPVLVILPKWQGAPDPLRATWIGAAELRRPDLIERLLAGVDETAKLVRPDGVKPGGWEDWTDGGFPALPTIDHRQLLQSRRMTALVGAGDGILLGETRHGGVNLTWLADPDPFANHGLAQGDNAAFAVSVIRSLIRDDGPVVFDETIHGYEASPPSRLAALFRFPFVLATVQAVLVLGFAVWSGMARFGAPAPLEDVRPAGKQALLDSTAGLLHRAGYDGYAVRRYFAATLDDIQRRTHAPAALDEAGQLRRLKQIGDARGATVDPVALRRTVESVPSTATGATLLGIAAAIHRWRREIIDGRGPTERGAGRTAPGAAGPGAD